MTDSTSLPSPDKYDPVEAIRHIVKTVTDMVNMLRAQRDLLAQRGMSLPTEPLDALQRFGSDLSVLIPLLGDDQAELQQLRELARTTQIINTSQNITNILNDVIDTVIAQTRAERGYIVLRDPHTGAFGIRVARKINQSDLTDDEKSLSNTIVQRVVEQGEPVVTVNAQEDARFVGAESVFDFGLRSILCVPMKHKGQVIGVIYADNRMQHGVFTEREQRVVSAFANQAAIAIENARLFERLLASLDEITAIKDFMDNVFDSIASGIIAADLHDSITTLNAAAARILEFPADKERSIGQSLWAVLPEMYEGFAAQLEAVRAENRELNVEVEPVIGRRQVSLNLKVSPFKDAERRTQGVAVVIDDLTEIKQQQARLSVVRRYLPPEMVDNIRAIDELELGGVEREISVLFCDVRGFTAFSEALPPELLMTIINRYLAVSSAAISEQGGIIDKYMGDAVVGLFNTQLNPQPDHALCAVRAALAMVHGVRALHESLPPDQRLFYGIGVDSGSAILGNVGSPRRKEFTVVGETLQVAKLLQENALGGEVLISESTLARIRPIYQAEPIQPRRQTTARIAQAMYRVIEGD